MPLLRRPASALAPMRRRPAAAPAPDDASPAAPAAPNAIAVAALRDEAWSELTALSDNARRKHVHWVHVRTFDSSHRQPESFSRQGIFDHLVAVYKEVYPEEANDGGSIVLFGLAVKERHAHSDKQEERDEHNHIILYCSQPHYWARIARVSLEKYHVKLHAACHDGYTSMYRYVREQSPKKPISEIDAEAWMSPRHPRGDLLRRLLEAGAKTSAATRSRSATASSAPKRFRTTDFFALARETGFRTAAEVQERACLEGRRGDTRLAETCTSLGTRKIQEYLDSAWAVLDAPENRRLSAMTRMDKLRHAADNLPCLCGGVWAGGATYVLQNNGEDVKTFCADVLKALDLGARRGVNLALVGGPGMGKSMLFESMDLIFNVCGKPEFRSTFPLAGVLKADILVWQEFMFHEETLSWDDLLNLVVGERVNIRVPSATNVPYRNTAPMFYTADAPISAWAPCMQRLATMNSAMAERFKIRRWHRALPQNIRRPDFPKCGRCSAKFFLDNGQ